MLHGIPPFDTAVPRPPQDETGTASIRSAVLILRRPAGPSRRMAWRARFLAFAVLAMLLPAVSHASDAKPLPFEALFGGPFELTDHHGQTRTDADFRGDFMLVAFGYTNCPDICPTTLQLMTSALELLGPEAERLQPLFITVDPARDTVDALAAYMRHFHPRLLGLTGSEAEVRAAAKAYKVHRRKVILPEASGPDDYLVDHGSNLYLMGPDGGFLTLFHFRATSAEDMAAIVRKYLTEAGG